MSSIKSVLIFSAIVTFGSSASLPIAKSDICKELCHFLGGDESLLEHACVCSLPQKAVDQATLEIFKAAQLRAELYNLPLALELEAPGSDQPPTPNHIIKRYILRRLKRDIMNPDLSYLGEPIFGQSALRPHNSNNPDSQAAVYEIVIGDNNDDSVQLVFPHSVGMDVKHQYLYETPDGVEHPYSDFVQESSYSVEDSSGFLPIKKNLNKKTGPRKGSNSYDTGFSRMMDSEEDSSVNNRDDSEEEHWSSEFTNTEARNFHSEEHRQEDGYDEFNMDYGTSTSDFTTPTYTIQTIDEE